jgi:hypothetical protein
MSHSPGYLAPGLRAGVALRAIRLVTGTPVVGVHPARSMRAALVASLHFCSLSLPSGMFLAVPWAVSPLLRGFFRLGIVVFGIALGFRFGLVAVGREHTARGFIRCSGARPRGSTVAIAATLTLARPAGSTELALERCAE